MAVAKGFATIVGFKKATTWGTAVAAGANDGLEILSESWSANTAYIEDNSILGQSTQRQGQTGNKVVAGDLVLQPRYEGLEPIMAQIFGTAGAPTTVDTSAKQHKLRINDVLDGIFGTLAIKKGLPITHEIPSVKMTGLSLKCSQGARAELTLRGVGHSLVENTGSGTNNNTTMGSVTLPTNRECLLFRGMVVRLNAQSGAGLAASDKVYVTDFSVDVDRTLKTDDYTTQFGDKIEEPFANGFGVVKGSLTFSKFVDGTGGNAALFTAQYGKTPQKMDVTFTGDTLAGSATQYFQWLFQFPYVVLTEGTPMVSGPGLISWTASFQAFRVATAPTGMTALTEPVALDIFSQRTTDALA